MTRDVPWLRVPAPDVSGPQQTAVTFEADSSRLPATGTPEGRLLITANAGQKLTVRVRLSVQRAQNPPRPSGGGGLRHALRGPVARGQLVPAEPAGPGLALL